MTVLRQWAGSALYLHKLDDVAFANCVGALHGMSRGRETAASQLNLLASVVSMDINWIISHEPAIEDHPPNEFNP